MGRIFKVFWNESAIVDSLPTFLTMSFKFEFEDKKGKNIFFLPEYSKSNVWNMQSVFLKNTILDLKYHSILNIFIKSNQNVKEWIVLELV
jgi:hypothetical protein